VLQQFVRCFQRPHTACCTPRSLPAFNGEPCHCCTIREPTSDCSSVTVAGVLGVGTVCSPPHKGDSGTSSRLGFRQFSTFECIVRSFLRSLNSCSNRATLISLYSACALPIPRYCHILSQRCKYVRSSRPGGAHKSLPSPFLS
jgi:hypothetical protein